MRCDMGIDAVVLDLTREEYEQMIRDLDVYEDLEEYLIEGDDPFIEEVS